MSGVPIEQSGLPGGKMPFVAEGQFASEYGIIIGGRNFGCGSSREHAPLAIAEAGCRLVVAESYARIFYRNSVNGGYLVPVETSERLVDKIATGNIVEVDIAKGVLKDITTLREYKLNPLGDVADIIAAGGIFEYARKAGMLK
jgi:3-isopropylmalate/(R)-2-methylmalate dehydratase small subunit